MQSEPTAQRLFAGTVVHSLDAKNRVTVPSRWRPTGEVEFYAVPDLQKPAVALLLGEEIEELIQRVNSTDSLMGAKAKAFLRRYCAQATPCPLDKQGRVVLPAAMCSQADLAGEVVMAGTGRRIEIWNQGAWDAELEAGRGDFEAVANELGL